MTMLTMAKALNAGLRRALEADPKETRRRRVKRNR